MNKQQQQRRKVKATKHKIYHLRFSSHRIYTLGQHIIYVYLRVPDIKEKKNPSIKPTHTRTHRQIYEIPKTVT